MRFGFGRLFRTGRRGKRILRAGSRQGCLTAFRASPRRGIFVRPGGFRMTDRRFYLLLTLPVLALAAGEVFYAVVGITSSVRVRFGFGFQGSVRFGSL